MSCLTVDFLHCDFDFAIIMSTFIHLLRCDKTNWGAINMINVNNWVEIAFWLGI